MIFAQHFFKNSQRRFVHRQRLVQFALQSQNLSHVIVGRPDHVVLGTHGGFQHLMRFLVIV